MGEKAAVEAYDFLIGWLRSVQGLEWVAQQVEDEIALGSTTVERVSVTEESFDLEVYESVTARSKSKADFLARSEYNPIQRFEIVAKAIETVVIGGAKIQDHLGRVVAKIVHSSEPNITFDFDPGETGEIRHSYQFSELDEKRDLIKVLETLLTNLREDVLNAD